MRTAFFAAVMSLALMLPQFAQAELTAEQAEKGKVIYENRCIHCHGVKGRGDGPSSKRLRPKPRNFASGMYKFTYTQFGKLPQDSTIFTRVSEGLPGTSMQAWKEILKEEEIWEVVAYIKTFSRKFARDKKRGRVPKPIEIGTPPQWTDAERAEGKKMFLDKCEKCHGKEGRGSGPSAFGLTDDWQDRIWPRNLTKGWLYRGGNRPEDIFRNVSTGITGTPMPAFGENLKPEEIWKIVGFVDSIVERKRPNVKEVLVSKFLAGDLPTDPSDERWKTLERRYFPFVPNIIEGERWFFPTLESIDARSYYNDKEIAIWVAWDDRTASPLPQVSDKYPQNEPDALAIQLSPTIPTGMEKPYFLGGNEKGHVILWKWTNGQKPGVLIGKGILKQTPMLDENQIISVTAKYVEGQWQAVFKRSLAGPTEDDLTIEVGRYIPIAFNGWDGNNGEKNEQRAVSIWYWLLLEPPVTAKIYLVPLLVGLIVAAGEAALVFKAKNNN
ncbi:MAG: c-type cytochrome [Nitrospinota bacterium]